MAIKIVHIEGGLGNQMACYSVYVAAKESNPNDEFYIDTYLYDIKEAHSTISMWNGYELESVFSIEIPDIRTLFTSEQVNDQINFLRKSKFWKNNWNYDDVFIEMMKSYGISLKKAYGNVGESIYRKYCFKSLLRKLFRKYGAGKANTYLGYEFKKLIHSLNSKLSGDCGRYLYQKREGAYFYNITLDFMKSNFLHQKIGDTVRKGLTFKELGLENERFINIIENCNSVSLHVRRTDYLQFNEDCYKFGYFNRCVQYIHKHVENTKFFIFSDDLDWCKNNLNEIGLKPEDIVYFVGINTGPDSYKDMALMAKCKHNIATKSSFGWWGSFLNANPSKITITQVSDYVSKKRL